MSLIVKMMSSEDMPDTSPYKGFKLVTVPDGGQVVFGKDLEGEKDVVYITMPNDDTATYEMTGNVYVLNEHGKTVASRGTSNGGSEDYLKTFGERLGGFASEALEKIMLYADKTSATSNQVFLDTVGKHLLGRLNIGDPGVVKLIEELSGHSQIRMSMTNTQFAKALGGKEFGEITEILWHANQESLVTGKDFTGAVGEYLANMVAGSGKPGSDGATAPDAASIAAVQHAYKYINKV